MGVDKHNKQKSNYMPGMELYAKYIVIAEGAKGSITKKIINKFNLDANKSPQIYGIGLKELWEIPKTQHKAGTVIHTIGWPLTKNLYGGSFIYHLKPNLVSIGMVLGLDYKNPHVKPFNEFQLFKQHPFVKKLLQNGKRISYGARCVNEGGLQSIPKLTFPGGLLVGCSAGLLNSAKMKGTHNAIRSGIIAADTLFEHELFAFDSLIKSQQ